MEESVLHRTNIREAREPVWGRYIMWTQVGVEADLEERVGVGGGILWSMMRGQPGSAGMAAQRGLPLPAPHLPPTAQLALTDKLL